MHVCVCADDDSWGVALLADSPIGVNAVSWAPAHHIGGKHSDVSTGQATTCKRLSTAGCDSMVRVYRSAATPTPTAISSAADWSLEHTLSGHKDWVRDVAWSPASGLGVNVMASCSDDGSVIIWRQATEGTEWGAEALPPFPAPVWRVSWNTTGTLLAVSCGDNSVTLWKESLSGAWQQISTVPDPSLPAAPRPSY